MKRLVLIAAACLLFACAGASYAAYGYTTQIFFTGFLNGSQTGIDNAPITQEFNFWYLPTGPGSFPAEGVWADNTFPDYSAYGVSLSLLGNLVDKQNDTYYRSDAFWTIDGYNHTIMAGTITNADINYSTGEVAADLIPFSSVIHGDGSTADFGNAAYQGFDSWAERSGPISCSYYRLAYSAYTGNGVLTPVVPEPSSILALLTGLVSTSAMVIRRRK